MRFAMWGKTEQVRTSGKNLLSNDPTEWTMGKDLEWGANKDLPINLVNNPKTAVIDVTIKPSCNYFFLNKEKEKLWVNRIIEKNNEGQGIVNHVLYRNESQNLDQYTFVTNAETASIFFQIAIVNGESITESDIRNNLIMFAEGSSVTTYEPYTGGKPSPSPDYPQPIEITDQPVTVTVKGGTEQQSITLIPPRPFTKWDKLEKVDGVWCWVYRSRWVESYTDENITGEYISTTGGLDAGAKICYKSTPEPIPLSPSEQDKLNALTMYAGTTEVTNTGGCNMELTYTVDTKSYVDKKIAELSSAIVKGV